MAALGPSRDGAKSLNEHKKECEASKSKFKASLRASESKLSDAQQGAQDFEPTKDTVDLLATMVDEAEKALAGSQDHVLYHEDGNVEQSHQLLAKDAETANERERLSKLESQLTSLSADL